MQYGNNSQQQDPTVNASWSAYHIADDFYNCPKGCNNRLKKLTVRKESKNKGRNFCNCSADYGGCGSFYWMDEDCSSQSGQGSSKRHKTVGRPSELEARVATLEASLKRVEEIVENLVAKISQSGQ